MQVEIPKFSSPGQANLNHAVSYVKATLCSTKVLLSKMIWSNWMDFRRQNGHLWKFVNHGFGGCNMKNIRFSM